MPCCAAVSWPLRAARIMRSRDANPQVRGWFGGAHLITDQTFVVGWWCSVTAGAADVMGALDSWSALFVDAVFAGDDAGARFVLSEAVRAPDVEAVAALQVWVTSALSAVGWVVPAAAEPDGWPW